MQRKLDRVMDENREMKMRQASEEDMFAFLVSAITRMQHALDRLPDRAERIEKRLTLIDGTV